MPPQDVISRDNVSVKVSAVIYFRVVDAEPRDHPGLELSRGDEPARPDHAALGARQAHLDQMLAERDKLNAAWAPCGRGPLPRRKTPT